MSEPLSATAAAGYVAGAATASAAVGAFTGIDPGALIGAFAGSVIFIITSSELGRIAKLMMFVTAMAVGVTCDGYIGSLITQYTGQGMEEAEPIAALVSSALVTRILVYVSEQMRNPESFISKIAQALNFVRGAKNG